VRKGSRMIILAAFGLLGAAVEPWGWSGRRLKIVPDSQWRCRSVMSAGGGGNVLRGCRATLCRARRLSPMLGQSPTAGAKGSRRR
jgi:hypothetical protein